MALDSIQNKYIEGEGSPNGVVKGKKGFTYKDIITGDEYSSLGGDKWRIIKKSNTNLELTVFESLKQLDFENFVKGDKINVQKNNSNYIFKNQLDYPEHKKKVFLKNESRRYHEFRSIFSKTYPIGSTGRIDFIINKIDWTNTKIFEYRINKGDFVLHKNDDEKTYRLEIKYISVICKCYNLKGEELDTDKLERDMHISMRWELLSPVTLNTNGGVSVMPLQKRVEISLIYFEIDSEIFEVQEGLDTNLYGSQGTIFSEFNYDEIIPSVPYENVEWSDFITEKKDANLYLANNKVFEIGIKNGIITPQMLGFDNSLNNEMEFVNDSSDFIQKCINSGYIVNLPPGNYYLGKTLYVPENVRIEMSGNRIDSDVVSHGPQSNPLTFYKNNRDTTVFYSDKNIDFIQVQGNKVIINNGVILTSLITEHTKAAFVLDMNYDMWGLELNNITVYGSKDDLSKNVGNGTRAIYINKDKVMSDVGKTGFLSMFTITATVYFAHSAYLAPKGNEEFNSKGYWHNGANVKLFTKHCKQHFHVEGVHGIYEADVQAGSEHILAPGESYIDHYFNIDNSYIDVNSSDSDADLVMYSKGVNNYYSSRTSKIYNLAKRTTVREVCKIPGFGNQFQLDNPKSLYITDNSSDVYISGLNNPLKYINDQGATVTMKGYKAPTENWFSDNLIESDEILPEDLTGDYVHIDMYDNTEYLTSKWQNGLEYPHRLRIKNHLAFAELVIKDIPLEYKITLRNLSTMISATSTTEKIQLIYIDKNKQVTQIIYEEHLKEYFLNLELPTTNVYVDKIIIRYIGNSNLLNPQSFTTIMDISGKPRLYSNNPLINIGGGQTIYGDLKITGRFDADDIKGLTPIITKDTKGLISLSNLGGNFCNIETANTRSSYDIADYMYNAFAEVRIKRATQPTITNATYRPNKGTTFLPNTDMIMRVEYKGSIRGVEYWFENFSAAAINNIYGNASTASKLEVKRTINGVDFDGSEDITIEDDEKEPKFTKRTAFNKNFGTNAGTVAEGNHSHSYDDLEDKPTTLVQAGITDAIDTSATQSLTGTALNLSNNVKGIIYNEEEPSTSNEFTITNPKKGGYVVNYIDTTGKLAFPTITGVTTTITSGDQFRPDAIFKMIVESDGTHVEYFFVDYLNTTPEVIEAKDIDFSTLPTSDVGLASGKLWNNSGVLQIVP